MARIDSRTAAIIIGLMRARLPVTCRFAATSLLMPIAASASQIYLLVLKQRFARLRNIATHSSR
jgi:hypothetical protein